MINYLTTTTQETTTTSTFETTIPTTTTTEIPTTAEDLALKRLDTFDEGTVKNVTEMSDTFTMTDVMGLLPGMYTISRLFI